MYQLPARRYTKSLKQEKEHIMLLELFIFTPSVTDVSPESEKESLGYDLFLFFSEDHERVDRS